MQNLIAIIITFLICNVTIIFLIDLSSDFKKFFKVRIVLQMIFIPCMFCIQNYQYMYTYLLNHNLSSTDTGAVAWPIRPNSQYPATVHPNYIAY